MAVTLDNKNFSSRVSGRPDLFLGRLRLDRQSEHRSATLTLLTITTIQCLIGLNSATGRKDGIKAKNNNRDVFLEPHGI